ncbi:glycosyltransferase [Candidatus Pelagibacter sp.]|jgi:dolichol-phosphate mannosyltransferase|nr:glycosyltransferase [Candidatus Pelagibacter sp.]
MSYSVILPTLNEAGHIIKLVEKINTVFLELNEKFEIIVVDDDSTDGTERLCNEITKVNKNFKFFSRKGLKKNLADSINLGIQESIYENIIWMDADFQHPPDFFKQFHNFKNKYDVLIFSRFLKDSIRYFEKEKFKKELNENQSVFFNKLCNTLLYKDITDYTSGFICIKKKNLQNYQLKGYYGEYFIDLINYCKTKKLSIMELPFIERKRDSGISKTFPSFSFRYLILLYKYFFCLMKNIIKKNFIR